MDKGGVFTKYCNVNKIDPIIRNTVRINRQQTQRVILFTNNYSLCKDRLLSLGIHITGELPLISGYIADVPWDQLVQLSTIDEVSYIAADLETRIQMDVATRVLGVDRLRRMGLTGRGTCIALVDTGIYPHKDFTRPRERIRGFVNLLGSITQPYDDNGHGTFTAGVAAGSGFMSKGKYTGIAPEADIIAIRAMDTKGQGTSAGVLAAMQWVADNRKRYNISVVSLSLGASANMTQRDDAMIRGAEALWDMGVLVVAAAGNNGPKPGTITIPGVSAKLLTVGALDDHRTVTTADDTIPDFSGRGPAGRFIKPDIVAPGVDIVSTQADTSYRPGRSMPHSMNYPYTMMSGTSVATPMVAGLALLLKQDSPHITPTQIKRLLMERTMVISGDTMSEGKGLVQIYP